MEVNIQGFMEAMILPLQISTKTKVQLLKTSQSEVKLLSRVRLFATPWTVAYQAPPSMGFSRQEYWSGLPFPSPGDLPDPGIESRSPAFQADALTSEPPGKPRPTYFYQSHGLIYSSNKRFLSGHIFSDSWVYN